MNVSVDHFHRPFSCIAGQRSHALIVMAIKGELPVRGESASGRFAVAGVQANRPPIVKEQHFKSAVGPAEHAGMRCGRPEGDRGETHARSVTGSIGGKN